MSNSSAATLFANLKKARRLPSPPGTALRVLELCRREDSDVKEITEAVMADPALSGRLLRYANSAATGASREITSVRDAVLFLGLRAVKLTALGFSLAGPMEVDCPGFSLRRFWTESVLMAILARRFAAQFGAEREEAFTAGLLSKIGRLALAHGLPKVYAEVVALAELEPNSFIQAERSRLGTDHVDFGARLLQQWGLPERLVQAVSFQIEPRKAPERSRGLALTVYVAAQLTPGFLPDGGQSGAVIAAARTTVDAMLGLDEAAWQRIAQETMAEFTRVGEMLDLELDPAAMFDLYAEAQEEATRVGIVAQLEQSRAREENESLRRRATTDALTGVANRARFDEEIQRLCAGRKAGPGEFALIMIDIDHFKKFNDTHGHAVGDLVLRCVAQSAQRALRPVDVLARYGGEEFAILAPGVDQRAACILTARVRKRIDDLRIDVKGRNLTVTISLGLALTSDYIDAPTAERLIDDADKQLYLSKHAGRNTWSYLDRSAAQVVRPIAAAPVRPG